MAYTQVKKFKFVLLRVIFGFSV